MSVVVVVNGASRIETSRVANGLASALTSGTAARVVLFVKPRPLVTLAREAATSFNENLSRGAGSKCSTSVSSSGTAEMLRMVTKSPILKDFAPFFFFFFFLILNSERKDRCVDIRQCEGFQGG